MLLEFSCSNFKSIKDEVTITFRANSDDTHKEELKKFEKYNILRSAVIYGPNGSGKSNFINSLIFLKLLVSNSIQNQPGETISQMGHKLNNDEVPTEFNILFVKNNIRYAYGISIKKGLVNEEYLYYFPNGKKTIVFEREQMKVTEGTQFKNNFKLSYDALKENRLFLSCIANFSKVDIVVDAYMFFKEDIVIYNSELNNWRDYSAEILQNNQEIKEKFIKIMRALGTDIIDVKSIVRKRLISEILPQGAIPDEIKSMIKPDTVANEVNIKLVYEQFETDLIHEESRGVQKLFEILCPLLDIVENGKLLIFDEIETSLHEIVVRELLKIFKFSQKNKFAQLLFSTHDTSLLDSELFRRDQSWFTELNKERATDLYSLIEIRNVRKNENYKNGYINGKYRAIPILSQNIFEFFRKEGDEEY